MEPPISRVLIDFDNRLAQFVELGNADSFSLENAQEDSEDIDIIAHAMSEDPESNPIERGVAAVLAFHNRNNGRGKWPSPRRKKRKSLILAELIFFQKPTWAMM